MHTQTLGAGINYEGGNWTLPKCVACDKEVVVSPGRQYVYVNINIGKPGKEKPLYFHLKCFGETIKKKSKLSKEITKTLWWFL